MNCRPIAAIAAIATIILASCMNQEERTIRDYINSKLTATADKAADVEILSVDSVLSFIPLIMDYNYSLRTRNDSVINAMQDYFLEALQVREDLQLGKSPEKSKHQGEWRRCAKVKVTSDNGSVHDRIEVIFDVDGTPMMTGNEYDLDLSMWEYKINALNY